MSAAILVLQDMAVDATSERQRCAARAEEMGVSADAVRKAVQRLKQSRPSGLKIEGRNILTLIQELSLIGLILSRGEEGMPMNATDTIQCVRDCFLNKKQAGAFQGWHWYDGFCKRWSTELITKKASGMEEERMRAICET